jgi:hypothetical protein
MFGRGLVMPVDDVPDAPPPALDVLADDFASHGYRTQRLLRVIARTRAFRAAAFPVTRLRAEQAAASALQVGSLAPLGRGGPYARAILALQTREIEKSFGDRGEHELDGEDEATVAQRLLVMAEDEERVRGVARAIARAKDDSAVRAAFLVALTRPPGADESRRFEARLAGTRGAPRERTVTDLLLALRNTAEASWNH